MGTMNIEIFESLALLQDFATAEADVTQASIERVFPHDGQWYLIYWTA